MKFFHACAHQRRQKNFIRKIHDDQNTLQENPENIEGVFYSYFSNRFSPAAPNRGDIEQCIKGIQPRVTHEMNSKLMALFTKKEVETTLRQLEPLKSLGPDGYGAGFYKTLANSGPRRL